MKAIILAGGSGTRLWPLSRRSYPKQFLNLGGQKTLLQQAVDRVSGPIGMNNIIVMTSEGYRYYVSSNLQDIEHVILEPIGRNTAPAIALGIKYCLEKLSASPQEVLFICPSDHIIMPPEKFGEILRNAEGIAGEGKIVTFGVVPTRPETGYGYIKASEAHACAGGFTYFDVEGFTEKPDIETAKQYVSKGNYYWNAGMFAFRIDTMIQELCRWSPEIGRSLSLNYSEMISQFAQLPEISIDYAVMEKSNQVVTIPFGLYWNDIGSWDSLFEVLEKDEKGNAFQGDVLAVDTTGTMVIGNKRLITTIGLEDCLVVETEDAVLIAKKGETQKIREVVRRLNGRKELAEHLTIYRPWGSYTLLEKGPSFKIKRIVVKPKEKLSLQMHYHRSEHWVVVNGTARVTIGEKVDFVHVNESMYVPKATAHRLENPGKIPLEIIEVQNGEYLEEDDIVRFEDSYGRG